MAGPRKNKRPHDAKGQRPPFKKRRQQLQQYNSDSDEADENQDQDFTAVDLMDSDEDILNATVDDGGASDQEVSSSSEEEREVPQKKTTTKSRQAKPTSHVKESIGAEEEKEEEEEEEENDDEDDDEDEDDEDDEDSEGEGGGKKSRSKRNDPSAFATSLSKILSTKLSSTKRSDPVLARSAAAHEASKAAVDTALETKARSQMREQKRRAKEKGRVRDVLLATNNNSSHYNAATGELEEKETTTADILATEKRLRKTAQRGVVKLFNAVRAAQVSAAETEKNTKKAGVIGIQNRGERVNEMSKKGFLELIASGGGNLKKGPIEEA